MEINGYKALNSDMTDNCGNKHAFDDGISLMKKRNVNNGRQINN